MRQILTAIEKVTGASVPVQFEPRRAGDPQTLEANPSKAKSLLGFEEHYSHIDTIVRTAAPFFNLDAIHDDRAA